MIKPIDTRTLSISAVKTDSKEFNELNKAQSVSMALPEVFKIPETPEFAVMKFNNLLTEDKAGNKVPRQGLGVQIELPNGETKVITVSSLTRKFFDEEIETVTNADGTKSFVTSGKSQRAVIDAFQDVNTMNFAPSELIEMIKGKDISKTEEISVWNGNFKDGNLIGYDEVKKAIFTIGAKASEDKPKGRGAKK